MPIIAAYYNGSDLGNVSYNTNWFWAGWVFQTSSSPPLLEKIGFQRNSSYTPGTGDWIAVAVARLDANNQIIEVAAYKQWVGAEIGSGGAAAVWHTISPIGLQPNTKYAVLYARNSNAVSAVNKFPAQGSAITVDGTTVATIEGQHPVSGLGAGPQLSIGGTVTISTAAPTWATAGNWGQLISLSVPDPLPLPKITLIAEAALDGSPELVDVDPVEMGQGCTAEAILSAPLEFIDIGAIEMGQEITAGATMSAEMRVENAEGYYFATAPITQNMPNSAVGIVGVYRDGIWHYSAESAVLNDILLEYIFTGSFAIRAYGAYPEMQPKSSLGYFGVRAYLPAAEIIALGAFGVRAYGTFVDLPLDTYGSFAYRGYTPSFVEIVELIAAATYRLPDRVSARAPDEIYIYELAIIKTAATREIAEIVYVLPKNTGAKAPDEVYEYALPASRVAKAPDEVYEYALPVLRVAKAPDEVYTYTR